jgi:aspartate aminotransferase
VLEHDSSSLEFGDSARLDAALSERARGLVGSEILKIAAEIRARVAAGGEVCNLTVGDFDPKQFPVPRPLLDALVRSLEAGETNYPPSDGMPALREAVAAHSSREWGVRYPVESVLIAGGARPILYAAYRCVLDPGETVVYPVPSWNNNHYAWLASARGVPLPARAEHGFLPTLEEIRPHLAAARLLVLNSPLNPSGSVIDPGDLRAIAEAVAVENARRARTGERPLFFLYDQVYGSLVFGGARHAHPAALVPACAPWVITVDGISKTFASTGLRVGWTLAAPAVTARMRDFLGHVGAWAPRAEQVATAAFLRDERAIAAFRAEMNERVRARMDALHEGFECLRAAGYPVASIRPRGAIYLTLRFDLVGRTVDGEPVRSNEAIRRLLLDRAGFAVVPFQAFGLDGETGWFRLSVGAVSPAEIEASFPRIRTLLDAVR